MNNHNSPETPVKSVTSKHYLCFTHANGFPAGSYQYLFENLTSGLNLFSKDKFGHDLNYPISLNWPNLIDEYLAFVEEQHGSEPFYAVGHSFGAVLSYMVACKRPDLVKGLIMLEPPLVNHWARILIDVLRETPLRHTNWLDKITPSGKAATRCTSWSLDTDLVAYFSSKSLFKNIHPKCVQDYVDSAISQIDGQYRLTFDHNVEAALFRTFPTSFKQYFGKLKCPSLLVTGSSTDVCIPSAAKIFIKGNSMPHQVVEGGHMFPLEYPEQTVDLIKRVVRGWKSNQTEMG